MKVIRYLFVYITLIFFLMATVSAVGITPAYYKINFVPGLKQVFHFKIYADEDWGFKLIKDGDLAEYAQLSVDRLKGNYGEFNVLLQLPNNITVPGTHRLFIGGMQVPPGSSTGFSVTTAIRAVIFIEVPYPGQYAEGEFQVFNANAGNPAKYYLRINNKGKEAINTLSTINIYDETGKLAGNFPLGLAFIESTSTKNYDGNLDTVNIKPGDYKAVANVFYGDNKNLTLDYKFRLGELNVKVVNYTREVERGKINKIFIEAESFWNDPIENLFANVSILNTNISFLTPSVRIEGFQKVLMEGFFDTTPIALDHFKAKILLNYEGKQSESIVDMTFVKDKGSNMVLYIILAIVIAIVLITVIIIIVKVEKRTKVKPKK